MLFAPATRPAAGSAVVCAPAEFREQWDIFTEGQLRSLNWQNVFAAGGSVQGARLYDTPPLFVLTWNECLSVQHVPVPCQRPFAGHRAHCGSTTMMRRFRRRISISLCTD